MKTRGPIISDRPKTVLAGNKPLIEVSAALNIGDSAASYLVRTADAATLQAARIIADR
jgi:hypothetical protein